MSVSERLSLTWAPSGTAQFPSAQLFESATVISGQEYYIDLRLGEAPDRQRTLSWAFAGTRAVDNNPFPESKHAADPGVVRCSWVHLLDSRLAAPNREEALVTSPHPDHPHRPNLSLELGSMARGPGPWEGVMTAYEEVWEDEVLAKGTPVQFYERLETSSVTRAFVGRVGNTALGIGALDGGKDVWCWRASLTHIPSNHSAAAHSQVAGLNTEAEGRAGRWETVFPMGKPIEALLGFGLLATETSTVTQKDQTNLPRGEVGSIQSYYGEDWVLRESWMT